MPVAGEAQRLAEAAYAQMSGLSFYHTFFARGIEPTMELAERLIELTPERLTRVFFANSGSKANDSAIKLIWYYNNARGRPEKKKILSRKMGYHGVTVATAPQLGRSARSQGLGSRQRALLSPRR